MRITLPATEYIRQTNTSRRPLVAWLIITCGGFLFLSLVFVAPLAAASNHPQLALSVYGPFSTLCHQIPERSFFIAGHKLAVCARCTGLYAGFALTMLLYPLVRSVRSVSTPSPKWLFLAAIPMAIDFNLTFFNIWENTHSSRFLTGFLLGGAAVFYLVPGIADLSLRQLRDVKPALTPEFTTSSAEAVAAAPSDYSAPHRRL